jgi:hypothetical protein
MTEFIQTYTMLIFTIWSTASLGYFLIGWTVTGNLVDAWDGTWRVSIAMFIALVWVCLMHFLA